MSALEKTALFETHERLGARLVEFAGWKMPLQYESVIKEHRTVRSNVGVFDVSHMGEIEVSGPGALAYCQNVTSNDVSRLKVGDVQYSVYCRPNGGIVDDFTLFRTDENRYMFIVNAANKDKDYNWMLKHKTGDVEIEDSSNKFSLLAVQGPLTQKVLSEVFESNLESIKFYTFVMEKFGEFNVMLSRTGYTGEDGFEMMIGNEGVSGLWNVILEKGKSFGITPAGLGARDTLRLEMGYALYGHDISDEITPLEAGLGWIVKLSKQDFIGKQALVDLKAKGFPRRFTGFKLREKGVPREKCRVFREDNEVGWVSSGTFSPSLGVGLGLAYIDKGIKEDQEIEIDIRGRRVKASVCKPPFVKGSVKK